MGRSKWLPSLGRPAGERLTVMRLGGSDRPSDPMAARTRSRLSVTALSGRPTTVKAGSPEAIWTWTSTVMTSMPRKATVLTRATMVLVGPPPVRVGAPPAAVPGAEHTLTGWSGKSHGNGGCAALPRPLEPR